MPLVGGNEDEHVDEAENIVCQRLRSRNEAGQSPDDQHGRGQREVVFAAERLQSLGQKGEQRQENGVGGGVPPQAHAQRHDALHHEFHAEVGPVEHEVERYEDKASEQELAFHDPHALEVGFDGLFPVEEEPCGDGEEDDDAHLAAALHHELEEDPLRPQGEFQYVIAVMDDEVMGEDHEHRDDAQQLDAGIPLLPICDSGMCRCAVFDIYVVVVLRILFLFVHNSPLVCGLSSPESYIPRPTGIFYEKMKSNKCLRVWYAAVED